MSTSRTYAPKWLGKVASKKYVTLVKSLPELTDTQKDLAAMLADAYETYLAAAAELQAYAEQHKSLNVTNSQGNLNPHPAFRIQQQAHSAYIKTARALRISLEQAGNETLSELTDEISDFFGAK